MTDELKPCQCGCNAPELMKATFYTEYPFSVKCHVCKIEGKIYRTKEAAISVWNNRPLEDALRAENARLRAEKKLLNCEHQRYLEILNHYYKRYGTELRDALEGEKLLQEDITTVK